jgi:hypothetical protein
MQKKINPMLQELAEKYKLPVDVVKSIVESPYFFTKDTLRTTEMNKYEDFPHFRYKFLGSLVPNKTRIDKINKSKEDGRE